MSRPVQVARARALGAAVGLVADRVLGEPPDAVHPVARFGALMTFIQRRWWKDDRVAGGGYALVGIGSGTAAGALVSLALRSSEHASPAGVSTGIATAVSAAGKALGDAASAVAAALASGDVEAARRALPALVGRDPQGLDVEEICRAVVESVAENTVDAVVAPALWGAAAGAPGALAHRAANTLDAMVGYRNERFGRFGWASARADDIANWLPARVTAAAVAAVRPRRSAEVWKTVHRDGRKHPSPNAGIAEAAFAGALGITLGGANRYGGHVDSRPTIGSGPGAQPADIGRALRLSRDVSAVIAGALAAPSFVQVARRGLARRGPRSGAAVDAR